MIKEYRRGQPVAGLTARERWQASRVAVAERRLSTVTAIVEDRQPQIHPETEGLTNAVSDPVYGR
ncbi:hypothetical protein DV706_08870 [Natronorubrum bangense]|uniref:Uncharacterized protein n=1 Tax=Natronorubrum bangense TaxID=61858 RepID=A0A4D6HLA2_9EURY|nr:hypothetical protein DV706_08870 [Natronorubrum bangense]